MDHDLYTGNGLKERVCQGLTTNVHEPFFVAIDSLRLCEPLLCAYGLEPAFILIVMEATASYWVSLAKTLCQAALAVSVINPGQAHYFAKAHFKWAKMDTLDAQTRALLAQALVASALDAFTSHVI